MLGCFPDPYPDELLYSLCARYHERVQYPNKKSTIRELFGDEGAIAIIDLPSNLGHLVSVLPPGHPYTVSDFINHHTLLPFFAPFLAPEQLQQLCLDMEGAKGSALSMRSGIMASTIQPPKWLRFCPVCAQVDKEKFGESYWHRLHQVPGVEVCPVHNVFLVNSQIRIQNPRTRHEFISATQGIHPSQLQPQYIVEANQPVLRKIAQDTAWLLQRPASAVGLDTLLSRYLDLLAEKDFATYSGRVRVSQLLREFCQFYPPDLLQRLQCELNSDSQHNWLFRLVRSPKGSQHPLRHLLLMHFLGQTAEAFFQLPHQFQPFGQSPWLCLNRAANHFRQPVIHQCELTYSQEHGKPLGTFACSCGFTYLRTGLDQTEEDKFKITKIITFGSIWEDKLKQLWQDPTVSLRGIARQLGVDPTTVKLHAAALALEFPRQGQRKSHRSKRTLKKTSPSNKEEQVAKRERYRQEWLQVRKENPKAGRTALKKQFQRIWVWLYRHDSDWLEANSPSRQTKTIPPPRVDWEQRDRDLAKSAKSVISHLKTRPEKPVKITLGTVARELGQLALIQQHLDKLPLTAQVIAKHTDTRETYALRRIQWATECYLCEGIYPRQWQLARRAGLRSELQAEPVIQNAINKAMEYLRTVPSQHEPTYPTERLVL